jgi:uncharacterized membrane protein
VIFEQNVKYFNMDKSMQLLIVCLSIVSFLGCKGDQQEKKENDLRASEIFQREFTRLTEIAGETNQIAHLPYLTRDNQTGEMVSIDALFSAIPFVLSQQSIGISIPVSPVSPTSVSVFNSNAELVYSTDNRKIEGTKYKLVITNTNISSQDTDAQTVKVDTDSGILSVRYVVPKENVLGALDTLRQTMISGALQQDSL